MEVGGGVRGGLEVGWRRVRGGLEVGWRWGGGGIGGAEGVVRG